MSEPEIIHVGRRDCPQCRQVEVADHSGNILDHNRPDGAECPVSDIDWNPRITLHPKSSVRRTYVVSTERLTAAERECEHLRSLLRQVRETAFNFGAAGVVAVIDGSGLLDAPSDPWDACRDVDPFTGQPDQHPCGDACEGACE